jgi:hypothetical protein
VAGLGSEAITALTLLAFIIVFRLALRKLWAADLLSAVFFWSFVIGRLGGGIGHVAIASILYLAVSLSWIWVIRHLGFLAMLAGFWSQFPLLEIPFKSSGWMAERLIVLHLIPVAIAACALWAVLSARKPLSTESAA